MYQLTIANVCGQASPGGEQGVPADKALGKTGWGEPQLSTDHRGTEDPQCSTAGVHVVSDLRFSTWPQLPH